MLAFKTDAGQAASNALMKQLERRDVLAGITTVSAAGLAGCSSLGSLNPFSSDDSGESESLPGPFRTIRYEGYDLIASFDPPRSGTPESGSNATQRADIGDVDQVLFQNSAGEQLAEEALGQRQLVSFSLLQLADNEIEIESALDLGRYSIVAVGPNGNYQKDVTLSPDLEVANVTLPNQLEDSSTPNSPLAFANPIVEFSNTGTSPAVIVESSFTGTSVPREREEADRRDEEENVRPGALSALFNDAAETDESVLALDRVPIPISDSTLVQTGFSPLAIPQSRYEEGGEEGGGVEELRRQYTEDEVDADWHIQIREGTTYEISVTLDLSGGLSDVNYNGTDYYVFRNPSVSEWDVSTSTS